MALYENTRDLVDALDPKSSMELEPSIEEPRELGVRVNPIFVSERVLPWWSKHRDRFLWETTVKSDVLASTMHVTSSRLFSIPVSILPRDKQNKRNRDLAYWSSALLRLSISEQLLPFIIDWQSQDNGCFAEIIGAGRPSGPLEPTKVPGTSTYLYGLGLRHLDAQRCTRTGDPDYPVIYETYDKKGRYKRYKLHHTRVLYMSQMRSPRAAMYGVGLSAISRCISHALHLGDISILKEEWLGARPVSEMIFGRGFSVDQLEEAFRKADLKADSDGLTRMSKLAFLTVRGSPEMIRASSLERIPLKRLPDGYNEEVSVTIGINIVAMAFGFDPRELWPATVRGATRADAEVSHLKTMRKTPGIWVEAVGTQLDRKWAPNACFPTFDQQDDEQDRVKGELRKLRAEELQIRLESNQMDVRTVYQAILEAGDITEEQYKYLIERLDKFEAEGKTIEPNIPAVADQPDAAAQDQEAKMIREAADFIKEQTAAGNIVSAIGDDGEEAE